VAKLLIAIPALNEETSIKGIIERCLAAKDYIISKTKVKSVDITVVSDGSTDKTVEYARAYAEAGQIKLIIFEKNKGYGAAIKEAWAQSDADYLSFIDADGTCDPRFFADLCGLLERENADVVLGGRIHKNSQMPVIRTIGNRIFATLLTIFSDKHIRDTASGMRVVRRGCLARIYPLPDGLHFTPAMSARAILSQTTKICEIEMPYKEREGRSKLSVVKDGVRFLKVILGTAFVYRPSRLLGLAAIVTGGASGLLMVMPTVFYLKNHFLLEWMQYRFFVFLLGSTVTSLLVMSSYIAKKVVWMTLSESDPEKTPPENLIERVMRARWFPVLPLFSFVAGSALLFNAFVTFVRTGHTNEHWSRFIIMAFFYTLGTIMVLMRLMDKILELIGARVYYLTKSEILKMSEAGDSKTADLRRATISLQ
jgi:glycosyltransferase involved in cell wall biosynthesis